MVKPTDQDMTAIKKTVCHIHRSQGEGACHSMGVHKGKHRSRSGGTGRGSTWARAFMVVSMGRKGQGRVKGLESAHLNNPSRF